MVEKISLKVEKRKVAGRAVRQLRAEKLLPANLFGKKVKSAMIQLSLDEFNKVYKKAGETSIIDLKISGDKETRPVLISAVQIHPVTGLPLHVDFNKVDLTQKVTATIPLEFINIAPAVEDDGAVIVQSMDELDVQALPTELPDKLVLDISTLKHIGDSLTVADIKVDKEKVTIDAEAETVIVSAQEPQKEEELPPLAEGETAAEAAVPAEGEVAATEAKPQPEKSAANQ